MIHFYATRASEFGLREFIEQYAPQLRSRFRFLHYEDLPAAREATPGTYVLSALDQVTREGLALVDEFERQLREAGAGFEVLNSARRTLQRYDLLDTLHRQGLNRHQATRVGEEAGLRYPVFLREEHQHNGPISPLLHTRSEVQAAVGRAIILGYRPQDLLLVEYFDAAGSDGKYRKFAAHIIGSRILPHFLDVGNNWELHHSHAAFTTAMFLEDQAYVRLNPHEPALRRIFEVAQVGFGRIDYTVKDGAIETWEINLAPTFARYPALPPELAAIRDVTTRLFTDRLVGALEAVDPPRVPDPAIPIRFSPEALTARGRMTRAPRRQRWLVRLAWSWKPGRRVMNWGMRKLSPLLARAFPGRGPAGSLRGQSQD